MHALIPRLRRYSRFAFDVYALSARTRSGRVLGDLGYEGEATTITVAFKKPKNIACTGLQQQFNRAHNAVRAIGERGNSTQDHLQSATRRQSLPWKIGRITAAALVILHIEHGRTT